MDRSYFHYTPNSSPFSPSSRTDCTTNTIESASTGSPTTPSSQLKGILKREEQKDHTVSPSVSEASDLDLPSKIHQWASQIKSERIYEKKTAGCLSQILKENFSTPEAAALNNELQKLFPTIEDRVKKANKHALVTANDIFFFEREKGESTDLESTDLNSDWIKAQSQPWANKYEEYETVKEKISRYLSDNKTEDSSQRESAPGLAQDTSVALAEGAKEENSMQSADNLTDLHGNNEAANTIVRSPVQEDPDNSSLKDFSSKSNETAPQSSNDDSPYHHDTSDFSHTDHEGHAIDMHGQRYDQRQALGNGGCTVS